MLDPTVQASDSARFAVPLMPTKPIHMMSSDSRSTSATTGRSLADGHTIPDAARRVVRWVESFRSGDTQSADFTAAAARLETRIRAHLERSTVSITFTDNRYTMISVRRIPRERRYEARLNLMFIDADPVITYALAKYLAENDKEASRTLGRFIDGNNDHVRGRAKKSPNQIIVTAGEFHDLREIFDDLNAKYFDNKITAAITWGPRTNTVRRRNSIKMGSYTLEDKLIRVHRALDRMFVPRYFVEWIVFHEMLHEVHGVAVKNGRREFHANAFLADEARFVHYRDAKLFERANIDRLLTY